MTSSSPLSQSPPPTPPPPWTPPPLDSLNFSSDCSLVINFYHSWYLALDVRLSDPTITSGWEDPLQLPYSEIGSPHWYVADSLDTSVVNAYFRRALELHHTTTTATPEDEEEKGGPISTGQIVDWELQLRREYREQRDAESRRVFPLLEGVGRNGEDEPTYDALVNEFTPSYFSVVLGRPGEVCSRERCDAYRPARLSDVNGPGVFITYWAQLILMVIASGIVMARLIHLDKSSRHKKRRPTATLTTPWPPSKVSDAVIRAVIPLVQSLTVFCLTTSYVLMIEYANKGPHYFPPMDRSVALCACGFSLVMTLWAWRLNVSLDFLQKQINEAIPLRHFPLLAFVAIVPCSEYLRWLKFSGPFDAYSWDYYQSSFCSYNKAPGHGVSIVFYGDLMQGVVIVGVVRIALNEPFVARRIDALIPWRKIHAFLSGLMRVDRNGCSTQKELQYAVVSESETKNKRHMAIGCIDLFVGICFGIGVTVIFSMYCHPVRLVEMDFGIDQWNFGQFLALSSLIPIVLEFLNCWYGFSTQDGNVNVFSKVHAWKKKKRSTVSMLEKLHTWRCNLVKVLAQIPSMVRLGRSRIAHNKAANTSAEPLNGIPDGHELGAFADA